MAKQAGPVYLTRTIDELCFYRMNGEYYVRMKSSLTGERVKTSKLFERTMASAGRLARGSKIASLVFKALPEWFKESWMYRAFVGEAVVMLKGGKTEEEVLQTLWDSYAAEFEEGHCEEEEFVHKKMRYQPALAYKTIVAYPFKKQNKKYPLSRRSTRPRERAPNLLNRL
jgi:hypothetical protein